MNNYNFTGREIIKPNFELDIDNQAGKRGKKAVKIINSALKIVWDEEQGRVRTGDIYNEEEQEYMQELISLAEKILKVNRWTEGIENEYNDLDDYENLQVKDDVSEREQEYIEVRNQLMKEELNTIKEYYELMADFMSFQQGKL